MVEKKETHPLFWPDGWPRTRPQDQRSMPSWKRTANEYREELAKELDRSKVLNTVISTNVPLNLRGSHAETGKCSAESTGVLIQELELAADTFRDFASVLNAIGKDTMAAAAAIAERHIRERLAVIASEHR